MSAQP